MTPPLILDTDALARLRVALGRTAKGLRPVGFRLDSEGLALAVTLPGPDYLAALLSLPGVDAYRDGARLLTRPQGSEEEPEALNLPDLADGLRTALAGLPDRADAGDAYGDLRLAAGTPSARMSAYVLDVVRAYVRTLPTLPKRPKAPEERPPGMTCAERVREHRERKREEERASARWALAMFLDDEEAPEPGSRVVGADLFEYVEEVLYDAVRSFAEIVLDPDPESEDGRIFRMTRAERLDEWREAASDNWPTAAPDRPRTVSRRVLYAVAEEQGHRVTRPGNVVVLTIARTLRRLKEATVNALRHAADVLGDRRPVEEIAAETFDRIGAPVEPANPDPALVAVAASLPFPVASAMASADDPRRALRLVGKAWAARHPATRPAIVDAARAFGPDLVAAVRYRVAFAVEEDAEVTA